MSQNKFESIGNLLGGLQENKTLQCLDISNFVTVTKSNGIGNCGIKSEEDCKMLGEFIGNNKNIRELNIRGNDFDSVVTVVAMVTCLK